VQSSIKLGSPPARPLLIFDGDCNFCRIWIQRWRQTTQERVDYVTFQDSELAARWPELKRDQL
jgi:predicted DCC family thiol-disulfide oxidoreductase YuxK